MGCNISCGKKLANTCSFVGRRIIVQQEKILERTTQWDEPIECASGGDPFILGKILHLLFFALVRILCDYALRVEKNYQHGLDAGRLVFQFLWLRGFLTSLFRTLLLCFGVRGKTPGLISRNNLVKKLCLLRPLQ